MISSRSVRALGTLVVLTCLGGCAVFGGDPDDTAAPATTEAPPEDVIARDLLDAFSQLDGYAPDRTAVRFTRASLAEDALLGALEARMREAGYAVGVVPDADAPGAITHVVETSADDARGEVHTLSIGAVQLRRRYVRTDAGGWKPGGSLFVRGADASDIRLGSDEPTEGDDGSPDERSPAPRAVPSPVPRAPALEPLPGTLAATEEGDAPGPGVTRTLAPPAADSNLPGPTAGAADLPVASRDAPLAFDPRSGRPVYSGLVAPALERGVPPENVMELGDSNFVDLFADYANVDELILTFPNDSLVLGERNKRLVQRAVERFDPRRDMFSIVGCSLGPTAIPNGNEALALGRANRVKEELLFAGVPLERIRDEGCWAGEAADKFPSRGVVLTHRRLDS